MNINTAKVGQKVRIHFAGSTQGLAMRAEVTEVSEGRVHFAGLGVMSEARFYAFNSGGGWRLSNGRAISKIERA